MPIPSTISDLSTTAASNSPQGSESPTEGDNYIRALSAIIAQEHVDKAALADLSATAGASLVGYTQGGTGAVARTLQSKIRDLVSVMDFGATGDGTTDDSSAIQAACDASRYVFFPQQSGSYYRCNSAITLRQDTHIYGASKQNTVVKFFGSDGFIADSAGSGTYDIRIEGLTISSDGTGTTKDGIRIDGTSSPFGRVELSNLIVTGFTRDGVSMIRPIVSGIRLVQSSSNGRYGFNIVGDGTSVHADTSYASLNTSDGWHISLNVQYSTWSSCASDSNGGCGYNFDGTIANPAQGITMNSCGAESNTGDHFKFTATQGLTLNSIFEFSGSGNYINLDGCRHVALNGIRMQTAAPVGKYALTIGTLGGTQFPQNVTASGCVFASVDDVNRALVDLSQAPNPYTFQRGVTGSISNGATVAHGLGVAPTIVLVNTGDSTLITQTDSYNTTTFRLLVQDNAGGFPAARTYEWLAIV